MIQQYYCEEKSDAGHFKGLEGYVASNWTQIFTVCTDGINCL